MNNNSIIQIELLSDATFSRGERTAGVVDIEVEHDDYGLPFLGGKTLRGLLRDTWLSMQNYFPDLRESAIRVFGQPADLEESVILRIGDAVIDDKVRKWIVAAQMSKPDTLTPSVILTALTDIRHQTSEDRATGAPEHATLRSSRVIIRGLKLIAPLTWLKKPLDNDIQCLALSLLGTRHAGLARNRGRGHIRASLDGDLKKTRKLAQGELK
jgi:hypothetical protein